MSTSGGKLLPNEVSQVPPRLHRSLLSYARNARDPRGVQLTRRDSEFHVDIGDSPDFYKPGIDCIVEALPEVADAHVRHLRIALLRKLACIIDAL